MEWLLGGLGLASAGTIVWLALRLVSAKTGQANAEQAELKTSFALEAVKQEVETLETHVVTLTRELTEWKTLRLKDLAIKQKEVDRLYSDLAECQSPEAVRNRLSDTLGDWHSP